MQMTTWQPPSRQLPSVLSTKDTLLSGISDPHRVARGLGWFSLGLGLAKLLAPRVIQESLGVSNSSAVMRSVGLREIASGVGILSQRQPGPWLWARVAGDVMDLALLGLATTQKDARRERIGVAAAAVAVILALDLFYSRKLTRPSSKRSEARGWKPPVAPLPVSAGGVGWDRGNEAAGETGTKD